MASILFNDILSLLEELRKKLLKTLFYLTLSRISLMLIYKWFIKYYIFTSLWIYYCTFILRLIECSKNRMNSAIKMHCIAVRFALIPANSSPNLPRSLEKVYRRSRGQLTTRGYRWCKKSIKRKLCTHDGPIQLSISIWKSVRHNNTQRELHGVSFFLWNYQEIFTS